MASPYFKMKNVGFYGGGSLFEIGPSNDIKFFFDCIKYIAVPDALTLEWSVLMDRFYRRYVQHENLYKAQKLMNKVEEIFSDRTYLEIGNYPIHFSKKSTKLVLDVKNLAEIFSTYFKAFSHCRESAELFFAEWKEYQPLKIVVADMPMFISDKDRPLADYDRLEGEPYWLARD